MSQYPTYHLAPNFSLAPPPDGMLHLGSIIDDLQNPEPINEDDLVDIPGKIYRDFKEGFTASRSKMKKGELGIWAKVIGLEGLGGEISGSHGGSSEVTYKFDSIETIYFSASTNYILEAMNKEGVREFLQGSGGKPVYMVTGLKIARSPAVSVKIGKEKVFGAGISLSQPEVIPVDVGAKVNASVEACNAMEFTKSSDFVIGIRVKKLRYKTRGWAFWRGKELVVDKHDGGASLVGTDDDDQQVHRLNLVDELPLDEENTGMVEIADNGKIKADVEGHNTVFTTWMISGNRI